MRHRFTFIFLLFPLLVSAQRFGGTRPTRQWSQIHTDTVRIIFPQGLDSQASRVASIVHHLANTNPVSLGTQLKKIDIVLQQQTVIPNAYVGLGPFRSEFYLTPPPDNFDQGSISWNDQLALHEYRHVQQFNNFNHGLSRLMRVLFGEEGYALAINAAIPDWFYEGDAVYNETVLTPQGRGRIPQFLNAFPSLWEAGKDYSWMKLRNGSLKDYVPNHYDLGFLLVNEGRRRYGTDFWRKVTRDASAYRGLFYPWQKAIRRYAGVDYQAFRTQALAEYKKQFEASKQVTDAKPVLPVETGFVTSYFFPYRSGDSLFYLKSSYRERPAFYLRTGNKEKRIRFRDISTEQQFSYRNGKIAYAAYETHPRWGWEDHSVIRVLDVASKRQKTITTRSKYFSPDISFDGNKLAAVHFDPSGRSELHILDAGSGDVLHRIRASDILLFTGPRFVDDNNVVSAVRLPNGKMTLALSEISSGNSVRLLPPTYNVIGHPAVDGEMIYFTASEKDNDDVFALNRHTRVIYRVTNGPLGNYFVNASGDRITWSAFTAEGYQLMEMEKERLVKRPIGQSVLETFESKFDLPAADTNAGFLRSLPASRNFEVKPYSKTTGLFNFHSWRPYFEDPVFTFSLYGQNVLNTLETEIYYVYNQEEKEHGTGVSATYGGWFPHINIGSEYTFNRRSSLNPARRWNQLDSRLGLVIPVSKTSGQTFKDFRFSNFVFLRNEFFRRPYADSFSNTSFVYLQHAINWIQQVQRAPQHIYPRLAWTVTSSYRHAVSLYEGYQLFASGAVYVPGLLANHNLILGGAFQQRDTASILFSSRFASARGYLSYYGTNAGSRLLKGSAEYHLPLLHPDWGFGNILYFQRIRANVFYDYQRSYFNNKRRHLEMRSLGAELFADTKWWNQYPLSFGLRVSRLLDDDPLAGNGKGSYVWEVVLPVAIIPR